jgi:uncharacterized Tic20 family protein
METNPSENHKNVAALIHLSTFTKFVFPFGNFVAPLLLWTINKDKPFVNEHGRQAVNFQLSILVYTVVIGMLCLPFFVFFATDFVSLIETVDNHFHRVTVNDFTNLSGYVVMFLIVALLLFGVFVFELYAVISATVHANRGELYRYPLSIPFIKTTIENQSSNEHVS